MARRLIAALIFALLACSAASAQGCGPTNPNCIVPDVPNCSTSNEQAANTKFAQCAISSQTTHFAAAGTTSGSANAQIISTTSPPNFALQSNSTIAFTAGFTNTGAMTLNVTSTGALNVLKRPPSGGLVALASGDIQSGQNYLVSYDGTQYELLTPNQGPLATQTLPCTVAQGCTNSTSASGTALDNITGFSSTGFLQRTGAGAYSFTSASGVNTGTQSSQTGNFTVQTTDCGKTFLFSSTSQATVTAAAASGFPAGCKFWIGNTGVYTGPSSARGLLMSSISGVTFPSQSFVLFPGQLTEFTNISNAWVETGYPWRQRWKPSAAFTFFADASNGSDTTADCLGTTTGACATLVNTFNRIFNYTDSSGGLSQAVISSTGTFSTGDVIHMAGPLPGGAGNAVLVWNGNGSTTVTTSSGNPCLAAFDHATVEISGLTCNGTVGNAGCFTVGAGAVMFFITSDVTCDPGTNVGFAGQDPGSKFEFVNVNLNFNSTGGSPNSIFFLSLGAVAAWDSSKSISLGNNMAFSNATIVVTELTDMHFGGTTFNLNAHTITGTRFICTRFSVLQGTGGAPNTFIPGNANGTVGSDCSAI